MKSIVSSPPTKPFFAGCFLELSAVPCSHIEDNTDDCERDSVDLNSSWSSVQTPSRESFDYTSSWNENKTTVYSEPERPLNSSNSFSFFKLPGTHARVRNDSQGRSMSLSKVPEHPQTVLPPLGKRVIVHLKNCSVINLLHEHSKRCEYGANFTLYFYTVLFI